MSSDRVGDRSWKALAFLESVGVAALTTSLAFGHLSSSSHPLLWLATAAAVLMAYLGMTLWAASPAIAIARWKGGGFPPLIWLPSLLFLLGSAFGLALLQIRPDIPDWLWYLASPIQPFPGVALGVGLLAVFLVKAGAAARAGHQRGGSESGVPARLPDVAIGAALLLLGTLQASVYVTPIGNAFLRFWALADAIPAGVAYPVTYTEPLPVLAGSPPHVYDLPLFPSMLMASFALLGHDSAAAHLPAAFWSALFPLSIYLLLREATGSRLTALVFGTGASLFPCLRFWTLNLPDPDALMLTLSCLAGYLYLRAWSAPDRGARWATAGLAAGALGLARPEGVLYAGCLAFGVLARRPGATRVAAFLLGMGLFLVPMVALWLVNFGFLWPENYNRTLGLGHPLKNLEILRLTHALDYYRAALGLDGPSSLALLFLFLLSVVYGTLKAAARDPRLLAMAVPGIGNTIAIFFADPFIPNTYHFADFFRHLAFGLPFLVMASAFGFQQLAELLMARVRTGPIAYALLFLMMATVAREGDIVANPTLSHRPGSPLATYALATQTYLSLEGILRNPMPLPRMSYLTEDGRTIASPRPVRWPEDALDHFKPLDMSYDSYGRPFGYVSVAAFLLALGFARLAESWPLREDQGSRALARLRQLRAGRGS